MVALVLTNFGKQSIEHRLVALQRLKERALVIKQHARNSEAPVVHARQREKLSELPFAEGREGGARVNDLLHPPTATARSAPVRRPE